ncbi:MAG: phosphoribosylglycinamide formyltransferase [Propylenella sp.]
MAEAKKRTAVIISGRGSNLGALIQAAKNGRYPAEISLVLSNRVDAHGLTHAREHGIPIAAVDQGRCETKAEMEMEFDAALRDQNIELICLAGFMRVLSRRFVESWQDRILNIHPSLLPLFPGLKTHERALEAGVRIHGATVHFVRPETDSGPIVTQGAVPVLADDTPEKLGQRVLRIEHRIYPLALQLVASGRAQVDGDVVAIEGAPVTPGAALLSPPD